MALDYDSLLALDIAEVEQTYGPEDCIVYALGLGLGRDPLDPEQLKFVYEKNLQALPTMANVLTTSSAWLRDLGVDWTKVVHGEQSMVMHRPLAVSGTLIGKTRVLDIVDKGADKGALVYAESAIRDKVSGAPVATLVQTVFCRGDGGFGGPPRPQRPVHALPQRAADAVRDWPTRPETALLYRLSGDRNPLHADPDFAARAGFPRPILHGLATFGIAGYAILQAMCGGEPARLQSMAGRFSSPVFPGETIRTEMWKDGTTVGFRARVVERDVIAIDNGRATLNGRDQSSAA